MVSLAQQFLTKYKTTITMNTIKKIEPETQKKVQIFQKDRFSEKIKEINLQVKKNTIHGHLCVKIVVLYLKKTSKSYLSPDTKKNFL